MFISMLVFRIIVLVIVAIGCGWAAFRCTPELDKVENKWLYRFSFWMTLTRGATFALFDMLGLFPLPE